jgi:Tetratricopeptide repeat
VTGAGRVVALLAVLFARAAVARADGAPAGAPAAAKPAEERGIKKVISRAELPDGLVLEIEPGSVVVRRGALVAPLPVLGRSVSPRALKGVVVEDDGGRSGAAGLRGRLIVTIEDSCDQKHEVSLTLANLNARIENVAALALYRQRKWADAADGFARALALDPGLDVAVTNLASAQVRGGKPDAAARTLAPLLAKAPVATYARVVSDPDLAPLLRTPEVAALRAPARGTARLALTKHEVTLRGKSPGAGTGPGAVAVSSKYPLVAAVDDEWSWGTCTGQAELLLLDFAGAEVARLPLFSHAEMTTDEGDNCPFRRAAKGKIGARVAAAQRLLADLGFSPAAGEEGTVSTSEKGNPRALFARAKLGVVVGRDRIRALRGDDELGATANPGAEQIRAATHLADANVVFLRWGRGGREGCEGSNTQGVLVLPLRGAATERPSGR